MAEDQAPRTFRLGTTRAATPGPTPAPESGRRAAAPKSQRPMAAAKDVERAVAMMDTLYALMADGFELFGLEETGAKWQSATTKLRRTNKDSLSASPKLARQIANIGEGGGATTFFLAHAIAIATLYPVAAKEMRGNLNAQTARHAAEEMPAEPDWDAFARSAATPDPGGYNVGEYIPGL